MTGRDLWRRYRDYLCPVPALGLTLDVSRMTFADDFLARMEPAVQAAFTAMDELEAGAIANPDENRMVGHYWLRAPELAPTAEITFAVRHTVAITGTGSHLDKQAEREGWLARFPMWDWVGGRTSETGPVGLVPAALQGIDIDALLAGAAACDVATRVHETRKNPAALLALA